MRFEVYPDRRGRYRWRLIAANGQIVASSAQSFASRGNALRATEDTTAGIVALAERARAESPVNPDAVAPV